MKKSSSPPALGTVFTSQAQVIGIVKGAEVVIVRCCDTPNQIETVIDQIRSSGRKGKQVELWVVHAFREREHIGTRLADVTRVNPRLVIMPFPKW